MPIAKPFGKYTPLATLLRNIAYGVEYLMVRKAYIATLYGQIATYKIILFLCQFHGTKIDHFVLTCPNFNMWIVDYREPYTNTWVKAKFLEMLVLCNSATSEYGNSIEPMDKKKLERMRKVKVNAATDFFRENGKPLIWYYKTKDEEIEYFTAPGLHPTNGETLKKITPYIIEKYVPLYFN